MIGFAKFPDGTERRGAVEIRAVGRRLEGYAAVFNSPASMGPFTETIRPGAFKGSLAAGADILALVDHDPGQLLGRTRSGTLTLAEDTRGLHFQIDMPDTSLGRDLLAMAERRDVGGMSFGFRATSEDWPAKDRRELIAVNLIEISVVRAFPAYAGTSVDARAANRARTRAETDRLIRRRFLETLA